MAAVPGPVLRLTRRAGLRAAAGWALARAAAPWGLAAGLLAAPPAARAGAQIEEPLSDAVRHALRAAVEQLDPPEPVLTSAEERVHYVRWLADGSWRLRRRKPEARAREDFLQTVWYESRRAGLDTALVLGLIEVESGFRRWAISRAGARGYMQVMPFWTRLIGDGDPDKLFHLQTNLRYGCVILRHYLDRERGDLFLALGRYNGSRGQAAYPNAVLAARRRWADLGHGAAPRA
ncbi:Membrane-bound lytic murein transglycosylase C [Tepidimonas sediminis]|uniref:Membrane-bound lytic murein transglycosylase C n=1 Tax=Tepidimonas sediminis TaxID=2588941 RepID=A0A554WTE3_9BURK|nr:lytic transglycosylase domain-containing protein [Tepidimonas sediminis]TSE26851.1 Membrane-bound lytic murein transglycosylase C [Tepidimonas sediminis]